VYFSCARDMPVRMAQSVVAVLMTACRLCIHVNLYDLYRIVAALRSLVKIALISRSIAVQASGKVVS